MKQKILFVSAALFGLAVAYIDSRPTWDDAGITAFALLVGGGIVGLFVEKRPWLFALVIGLWLPLWYILSARDWSMAITMIFPFVGVYVGWGLRLGFRKLHRAG